jgi:hypothetical protein
MGPFLIVVVLVLLFVVASLWQRQVRLQREAYIRHFELPRGLFDKLRQRRPSLSQKDCQLTAHALRQFFLAYLQSGRGFVSMPSQVADDLWHEFILYTSHYQQFCRRAFGRFLHHTPAVALGSESQGNAGLRRVWWFVCRDENIDPRKPSRLPLLFALDAKFGVADGFRYVPDCSGVRREGEGTSAPGASYCGGDFASSSVDGSTDGFGSSSSDGGSSSEGGGCSGGGCSS